MTSLRWLILALTTGCAVLPPAQIDPRQPRGESRILRQSPGGKGQLLRLSGDDLVVTHGSPRIQGEQYGHLFRAELLGRASRLDGWTAWRLRGEAIKRQNKLSRTSQLELDGVSVSTGLSTESLFVAQIDDADEDAWLPAIALAFRDGSGKRWQGGIFAARESAPRPVWHLRSPGGLTLEEPGGFARPLLTLDRPGGQLVPGESTPCARSNGAVNPSLRRHPGAPGRIDAAARTLDRALDRYTGPWDRSLGWSIMASASVTARGRSTWPDGPWTEPRQARGAWWWDPVTRTLDLAIGRTSLDGAASFVAAPLPRLWRGGRSEPNMPLRNVSKAGKRRQRP